jgi:deoxyribonuclease V
VTFSSKADAALAADLTTEGGTGVKRWGVILGAMLSLGVLLISSGRLAGQQPTGEKATYVGAQTCMGCHQDLAKEWQQLPHTQYLMASGRKAEGQGCEECHGPGGKHAAGDIKAMHGKNLKPVEQAHAILKLKFPYIPGLLAYREANAMMAAFGKVKADVDILMVDGFGINHPRMCGIATHIGVKLDMPTIGVGKSFLCGDLCDDYICQAGERVGKMVYSAGSKRPVYVSPGHKISLDTAIEVVEQCIRFGRQPEPTRLAHEYVTELKIEKIKQ